MIKNFRNNILNNKNGVSLLLAVLILSSLMVMVIAVSEISMRVGRTTREIGNSEIAYFAAEAAVERALYFLEKSTDKSHAADGLNSSGSLSTSGGSWLRTVSFNDKATTTCGSIPSDPRQLCVDGPDLTITTNNHLKVSLDNGESFQLDLNIGGCPSTDNCFIYPNSTDFIWSPYGGCGENCRIIIYSNTGQNIDKTNNVKVPQSGNLDPANGYRVRAINESGSTRTLEIKPTGVADAHLPLGVIINVTGTYQDEKRVIELERRNWQIY